jgi:GMP synthase (glutamine-hydrolysing)
VEQAQRKIWIVDFGSQYTQLITRKTRELGYSSAIVTLDEVREEFDKGHRPECLVLSGGPDSLATDKTDYGFLFDKNIPTLGICYGLQIMANHFGGHVAPGTIGEYGHAEILLKNDFKLKNCPEHFHVWMSHFDHVKSTCWL